MTLHKEFPSSSTPSLIAPSDGTPADHSPPAQMPHSPNAASMLSVPNSPKSTVTPAVQSHPQKMHVSKVIPLLLCVLPLLNYCCAQRTGPTTVPSDDAKNWTDAQRWAIACSAVLCEINHRSHLLLGEVPKTPANATMMRQELRDGLWEINSREDVLDRLDWIDHAGQRNDFEEFSGRVQKLSDAEFAAEVATAVDQRRSPYRLRYARQHYTEAGRDGLLGFDYIRYISLCRWAYAADYFTANESWARIMPVARLLQKTYTSWDALSQNYVLGRNFWLTQGQEAFKETVDRLLHDQSSPWIQSPWDTDLGDHDQVHEPAYRPARSAHEKSLNDLPSH
jgi:hypothetical protein